jgi:hypothetical protein
MVLEASSRGVSPTFNEGNYNDSEFRVYTTAAIKTQVNNYLVNICN